MEHNNHFAIFYISRSTQPKDVVRWRSLIKIWC